MYDIIVIGARPAGASSAYELSRLGLKVLIFERHQLPRYKTCGGGIPVSFFRTLPQGPQKTLKSVFKDPVCLGSKGRSFILKNFIPIAGVMRAEFDHAFVLSAKDAGADLMDANPVEKIEELSDRVVVDTKAGRFESLYLIGADGATGIVRRRFGLGKQIKSAPALEIEAMIDTKEAKKFETLLDFNVIRDGYGWLFPKGDVNSIGITSFGRDKRCIKKKFSQWACVCGFSLEGLKVHGHPIPLWKGKCQLSTKRIFLVGDAAGTVDPLTGEGIRHGVRSGRIASEYIERLINNKPNPDSYTDLLYREIHQDFAYSGKLADFFYRFPGFCFNLMASKNLKASSALGQVMGEELKYGDLLKKVKRSSFNPKSYLRLFNHLNLPNPIKY